MQDSYYREIIDPGDRGSALAHQVCVESYGNCQALHVVPHNPRNFRGSVGYLWQKWVLNEMDRYRFDADGVIQWTSPSRGWMLPPLPSWWS